MFVELVLAVVAAVMLLAVGFRARMGRELVLQEIARLEVAASVEPLGRELAVRHPYRSPDACTICPRERARVTIARR